MVKSMKKILVTGGAGYIGSHTIVDLIQNGFEVVSVDNFANSEPASIAQIEQITGVKVQNYNIDLCDALATRKIFETHPDFVGVIHFAAHKAVGESVEKPLEYYRNNIESLINVLQCVNDFKVPHFIFSSSCSVYGNSQALPVTENTPFELAESPYAFTKQFGEKIIGDYLNTTTKFKAIALRYFNPAGAHPSNLMGESAKVRAYNLVPVITEVVTGKRAELVIYGDDYDTRDGSCVRDYIHVCDVAHAHTLALQLAMKNENMPRYEVFNLGVGAGVSVFEVVKAFKEANGFDVAYKIGSRRAGDVGSIFCQIDKAKNVLGWSPKFSMRDIMLTAYEWEKKRK